LELIKDYDLRINYHLGKANVVADALSRRSHLNILATRELLPVFCKEFEKLNLGWVSNIEVITMEVDSTLEQDIRKSQLEDAKIQEIKEQMKEDKAPGFSVLKVKEIRELILREAHDSAYSIHPGSTKMYHDLKRRYWWYGMKRALAEYVALCDNCQKVKTKCQRHAGLLQPLKITNGSERK
jgi:F0F1-type ATP synthase gamma subunit